MADLGTSFLEGSERRACRSAEGHKEVRAVHRTAWVLHKSVGISGPCVLELWVQLSGLVN